LQASSDSVPIVCATPLSGSLAARLFTRLHCSNTHIGSHLMSPLALSCLSCVYGSAGDLRSISDYIYDRGSASVLRGFSGRSSCVVRIRPRGFHPANLYGMPPTAQFSKSFCQPREASSKARNLTPSIQSQPPSHTTLSALH
jgi:hypothetical protein